MAHRRLNHLRLYLSLILVLGIFGCCTPRLGWTGTNPAISRSSLQSPGRAPKSRHLYRAVRDLPEEEEYPEYEIENRKEERFDGACSIALGLGTAALGTASRSRPTMATGVAMFLQGLNKASHAHEDINTMTKHNERAKARKERNSDNRYRGDS